MSGYIIKFIRQGIMDNMFQLLLCLAVVATQCSASTVPLPDKLRVREISVERNETYDTCTVIYESPEAAKVASLSQTPRYGDSESFVHGQGVATVTNPVTWQQIIAAFLPGRDDLFLLQTNDEGRYNVPETEILCSAGEEIVYTPGVPMDINITWTNIPNSSGGGYFEWIFLHLKPSVSDVLRIRSRYNRRGPEEENFLTNVSESTSDEHRQISAKLNLQDESGLVLFYMQHSILGDALRVTTAKLVSVHPQGHDVFPQDFIAFPSPGLNRARTYCENGECRLDCYAFGPQITSLVVQDSNGQVWQPAVSYNNDWVYAGIFSFPPSEDQQEYNVSCVATNDHNQSAEHVILVTVYS